MSNFVSHPIPKISEEEMAKRAENVRVCFNSGTKFRFFKTPTDLTSISILKGGISEEVDTVGAEVGRVKMYTLRDAAGSFCPTMEEIVAQIPDDKIDKVRVVELKRELTEEPGGDYLSLEVILRAA